jgi:phosphoribosylformylglycinamidine cyclo-ligase
MKSDRKEPLTYAQSGVDIHAGDAAVERIKSLAAKTFNSQVLTGIGAFGGFFKPDLSGIAQPVLVSSADGVGTKLKLAFMTGRHDTVGEDLVNHCINDILVHGARPLFFLDYIATGKLDSEVVADIVAGMSRGCQNAGLALVGGETAEMPDFYSPNEYDLAGFIVGMVDQSAIIDGSAIREGDLCLGLPSNGLHTNGYSLARKAVFDVAGLSHDAYIDLLGCTVAEALMKVHTCYAPVVHPLLKSFTIHGMAHITGGGIEGNLKRVIPSGLSAEIIRGAWPVLPIFDFLKSVGSLDSDDVYNAFNMGIGYILVVPADQAGKIIAALHRVGQPVYEIGKILKGSRPFRWIKRL